MLPADPRVEALLTAARGRVGVGNADRRELALLSALGLTRSGLLEQSDIAERTPTSAGFAEAPDLMNQTFGITRGPEGQAFRDARTGLLDAYGSRGTAYGSDRAWATVDAERELAAQIDDAIRGFDRGQADSLTSQGDVLRDLAGEIAIARQEQAELLAAQAVPPEEEPGTVQSAGGGGGSGNASAGAGAPASARRQILGTYANRGYAQRAARNAGGGAQVRRRIIQAPSLRGSRTVPGGPQVQFIVGRNFRPVSAGAQARTTRRINALRQPAARVPGLQVG